MRRVASRRFASRRYPVPRDRVVLFFSFSSVAREGLLLFPPARVSRPPRPPSLSQSAVAAGETDVPSLETQINLHFVALVHVDGGLYELDGRKKTPGASHTLVPIRPRSRGERRSLRTFAVVSLRPPLAFNARPRRLSTPTDAFQLQPDVRSYGTTLSVPRRDDGGDPPRGRRARDKEVHGRRGGGH